MNKYRKHWHFSNHGIQHLLQFWWTAIRLTILTDQRMYERHNTLILNPGAQSHHHFFYLRLIFTTRTSIEVKRKACYWKRIIIDLKESFLKVQNCLWYIYHIPLILSNSKLLDSSMNFVIFLDTIITYKKHMYLHYYTQHHQA